MLVSCLPLFQWVPLSIFAHCVPPRTVWLRNICRVAATDKSCVFISSTRVAEFYAISFCHHTSFLWNELPAHVFSWHPLSFILQKSGIPPSGCWRIALVIAITFSFFWFEYFFFLSASVTFFHMMLTKNTECRSRFVFAVFLPMYHVQRQASSKITSYLTQWQLLFGMITKWHHNQSSLQKIFYRTINIFKTKVTGPYSKSPKTPSKNPPKYALSNFLHKR